MILPRRLTPSRVAPLALAAIGLMGLGSLTACDQPCEKLTQRLVDCAAEEPTAEIYRDPRLAEELRGRCRRAEPRSVTACLAETDCQKLRQCASRALERAPGRL